MSLINQMLKDLEHRRANELEVNNGALQGINRYVATGTAGQSGLLLGIVIALVILLSILVGYLFWDKYSNLTTGETISPSATFVPPVPASTSKKKTTRNNNHQVKKAKPAKKINTTQKNTSQSKTKKINKSRSTAPAIIALSSNNNQNAAEPGTDVVFKQNRRLTRTQQAGALYQKAYSNLQAGQVKLAEDQLRQSIQLDASYSRSRELLAGSYIRSGRYIEAGQLLEQGLKVEPKNHHFAKLYARVLMQQNKQQQALDMLIRYRPALQVDQEYYALVAALYQQTQQHQEAVNMYKDLLKLQSDRGIWWIGLGISLEKTGKPDEAREAYSKARDSGSLNASMRRYTDNKLAAIKESGYPEQE